MLTEVEFSLRTLPQFRYYGALKGLIPLFHQGISSADSEPEPSFKPVLCLSTPKASAPNQEKWFVSSTKTLLGQKEEPLASGAGGGVTVTNKTTETLDRHILKQQLNTNTLDSPCLDADVGSQSHEYRQQRKHPPLLIVCLGLFGMDRRCVDRSVCCGCSLCFWIALAVLQCVVCRSICLRGADTP